MKKHSRAYEQYCWVMGKNIVFEETVFHNGTCKLRCMHFNECKNCGGCKNMILAELFGENKAFVCENRDVDN